jgi:hypothetical protein
VTPRGITDYRFISSSIFTLSLHPQIPVSFHTQRDRLFFGPHRPQWALGTIVAQAHWPKAHNRRRAQNHCWCSVLPQVPKLSWNLSLVLFCLRPSMNPKATCGGQLSPPLSSPHDLPRIHSARPPRAPSQARRVKASICRSCFHCLFNSASPLGLSHPLHAPTINRLPPRQQRVCNVGPSSSLHQHQAVVSV